MSSNLSSLKQSKRYQACFTLWIMNTVQSLIQLPSSQARLCVIVQALGVLFFLVGFFSLFSSERIMDEKAGIPSRRMPCSWLLLVQLFSSTKLQLFQHPLLGSAGVNALSQNILHLNICVCAVGQVCPTTFPRRGHRPFGGYCTFFPA